MRKKRKNNPREREIKKYHRRALSKKIERPIWTSFSNRRIFHARCSTAYTALYTHTHSVGGGRRFNELARRASARTKFHKPSRSESLRSLRQEAAAATVERFGAVYIYTLSCAFVTQKIDDFVCCDSRASMYARYRLLLDHIGMCCRHLRCGGWSVISAARGLFRDG